MKWKQKRENGRATTEERVWKGDKEEGKEGGQLKRGGGRETVGELTHNR